MTALQTRVADDFRAAVNIAVGAANAFTQIAVAVFVAIGGFIQFAFNQQLRWLSWPVGFFALAAGLVLASMIFGFIAVSRAYRRGDGRDAPDQPPWHTEPLRPNAQSMLGLAGLLVFAIGIVLANTFTSSKQTVMTVKLDQQALALPTAGQSIVLEGSWNAMVLKVGDKIKLDLGNVPPGQTRSLTITPP